MVKITFSEVDGKRIKAPKLKQPKFQTYFLKKDPNKSIKAKVCAHYVIIKISHKNLLDIPLFSLRETYLMASNLVDKKEIQVAFVAKIIRERLNELYFKKS